MVMIIIRGRERGIEMVGGVFTGPSGCISCRGAVTSLKRMTWMCSRSSFSMMCRKSRLRQSRSPRMSPMGTQEESPGTRGEGGVRGC